MKRQRSTTDEIQGLSVEVKNGDFNKALRIFKKKVQESGILQELKSREEYVKPSEQRKRAKASARARWLKKVEKMDIFQDTGRKGKKK